MMLPGAAFQISLLPTPISGDAKSVRNATVNRQTESQAHSGFTLTDILVPRSTGDSTVPPSSDGNSSPDESPRPLP